ncbi:MAG: hypothetical protein LBD28_00025, partial [Tannerellaceae bacterium]|nr:hypothetical protein [Tannerellaceae bacterium]
IKNTFDTFTPIWAVKILAENNFKDSVRQESLRKIISGILCAKNACGKQFQGFCAPRILAENKFRDSVRQESLRKINSRILCAKNPCGK